MNIIEEYKSNNNWKELTIEYFFL